MPSSSASQSTLRNDPKSPWKNERPPDCRHGHAGGLLLLSMSLPHRSPLPYDAFDRIQANVGCPYLFGRSQSSSWKNQAFEGDIKMSDRPRNTPPVVSPKEWETARQQLLAKEKASTRARDALAAERRRMPWVKVEKTTRSTHPTVRSACSTYSKGAANS